MKKLMLKALFTLCSVLLLTACSQQTVLGHDSHGNLIRLHDLDGKWIVLSYWAAWCKPCYEEIPELNALAKAHPNVVVIGVNFDHMPAHELQTFARKQNIAYILLSEDPRKLFGLGDITALPTTFIIDPTNQIQIKSLLGPQTRRSLELAMNISPQRTIAQSTSKPTAAPHQ